MCTGLYEKVHVKFGEESSVKVDGLCIGCISQWAEVERENSNMLEFFCTTLYNTCAPLDNVSHYPMGAEL